MLRLQRMRSLDPVNRVTALMRRAVFKAIFYVFNVGVEAVVTGTRLR